MSLSRRVFLKESTIVSISSANSLQLNKYNIENSEYSATDLLRDLTDEARSAQIATGDLIDTAADSGVIDNVQIDNAGTINATMIINEFGSERDLYIYEGGGDSRLGYEYHSDGYDLGDRFVDLEKENRLAGVLNEFNELYLPELFDEPASELLPDDTETATDTQTETEIDEQNAGGAEDTTDDTETATDTQTEAEVDKQNAGGAEDANDYLPPIADAIFTIMGATGLTAVFIYRYLLKNNPDE